MGPHAVFPVDGEGLRFVLSNPVALNNPQFPDNRRFDQLFSQVLTRLFQFSKREISLQSNYGES